MMAEGADEVVADSCMAEEKFLCVRVDICKKRSMSAYILKMLPDKASKAGIQVEFTARVATTEAVLAQELGANRLGIDIAAAEAALSHAWIIHWNALFDAILAIFSVKIVTHEIPLAPMNRKLLNDQPDSLAPSLHLWMPSKVHN
jgi:hypothetical protein